MPHIRRISVHDAEAGKCPEWQRELTVNQPPHGFEGSSPSFPTNVFSGTRQSCSGVALMRRAADAVCRLNRQPNSILISVDIAGHELPQTLRAMGKQGTATLIKPGNCES
jgi:hypothetical protein